MFQCKIHGNGASFNFSKDNFDLKRAQKILDKDHFGLEDVKSEIVEVNLNNSRIKNEEFDINFEEDIVIKCLKKEKARYFLNSQSL